MNNSRLFPENIIGNPPFFQYVSTPGVFIEKSIQTESYTTPLLNSLIKGYLLNSIKEIKNVNLELDKILAKH